jgi:hypothetical protein
MKRLSIAILVVLAATGSSVPVSAQRTGGMVFAPIGRPGPAGLRGAPVTTSGHMRRTHRHFVGSGFWPYFYSDSEPESVEAPPQVVTPGAPAAAAQPATPAESVLLELHGDRWVRITNYGASDTSTGAEPERTGAAATTTPVVGRRATSAENTAALPRAALVFRDGHTEELQKYVIVGRTLYTTADYWTTGSWTRKVEIAELNVPATLKLNHERGTKFSLPSGPTEVMVRP